MAHRVIVMYAGRKVEEATVDALFATPRHPYTRGLLDAIPRLRFGKVPATHRTRLSAIGGTVPPLSDLPSGCAFAPRCPHASDICRHTAPALEADEAGHIAACWHAKLPVSA
jgi:peptide/nickel transport system ATP-binding protein